MNQICTKRYFRSKTEKVNIIEFCIFKLVSVPNLCFNWQFWFFWPDLSKKGFSGLIQKKWTLHIFYIILLIQISLVRYFSSNWQFWFLGPNWSKKVFPVKNRKSEHHHEILHIWISLGTKFQLKLIIFSFWTKFTQKRYFQLKTKQPVQGLKVFAFCVVTVNSRNVNSTVALNILKILKILLLWTFWKKNWLWALFILKLYKVFKTALCK